MITKGKHQFTAFNFATSTERCYCCEDVILPMPILSRSWFFPQQVYQISLRQSEASGTFKLTNDEQEDKVVQKAAEDILHRTVTTRLSDLQSTCKVA